MRQRAKRRETWFQLVLLAIGCAGLGLAAWLSRVDHRETPATAARPQDVETAGSHPASAPGGEPADRAARQVSMHTAQPAFAAEPPPGAAAIRKSQLPEWMRFRYEHAGLALSTESAVREVLDSPTPLREIAAECAKTEHLSSIRDLDLSAEIMIRDREITVGGWGCEASEEAAIASRVCDCLLAKVPNDVRARVPGHVTDADLAPYEGLLLLRLWL